MTRPRLLIAMGDTHVGSHVGIMPRSYETYSGNVITPNPLQSWYLECYEDATTNRLPAIIGNDPWVFVSVGDSVEGNHHGTKEIWSPDVRDHVRAYQQLVWPFIKGASSRFFVKGTECHTDETESYLNRELQGTPSPTGGAWDHLHLTIAGCYGSVTHHMSTCGRSWLGANGIGAAMADIQLSSAKANHPIPRWALRGHRHMPGAFRDHGGAIGVVGAWQSLTRYGHKAVPNAICIPTFVVMDWRNVPDGELPLTYDIQYVPDAPVGAVV